MGDYHCTYCQDRGCDHCASWWSKTKDNMTYAPFTVEEIWCRDCGTAFHVDPKHVSASKLDEKPTAVLLVYVPKQCPVCRNIKVVLPAPRRPTPSRT